MARELPPFWALVAMGVAGAGLLLQIIGVSTAQWVTQGADIYDGHAISKDLTTYRKTGLWYRCSDGASDCFVPDWLYACRVFGIAGVLTMAASLTAAAVIRWNQRTQILYLPAGLAFTAALFILIEFSVFADYIKLSPMAFEYFYRSSFALTVLAFHCSLAAGTIFLLAVVKNN